MPGGLPPGPLPQEVLSQADKLLYDGYYSQAALKYQQVFESSPPAPLAREALLGQARSLFWDEKYVAAIPLWHRLVTDFPNDEEAPRALFFLAASYRALGLTEAAVYYYRQYVSQRELMTGYVAREMAKLMVDDGNFAAAREEWQKVIQADVSPQMNREAEERIAGAYWAEKNYPAALSQYQGLLLKTPSGDERARIRYLVGQLYDKVGSKAEYLAAMRDIVANYPARGEAGEALAALLAAGESVDSYQRGLVEYYQGNGPSAISHFRDHLARNPQGADAPAAYFYMGDLYQDREDSSQALEAWQKVATLFPQSSSAPKAMARRARLLESLSRWEEAAADYRRLQAYGGDYATDGLFREGLVYFKGGQHQKARDAWLSLSSYGGEAGTKALVWLGKSLWSASGGGSKDEATSYWQRAAATSLSYYSLRAGDLLRGDSPFSPPYLPPASAALSDETAERQKAEAWLANWWWNEGPRSIGQLPGEVKNSLSFRRGEELWRLGQWQEAVSQFREVLGLFWREPLVQYQLSLYFRDQGIYSLSISAASRLLDLAPQAPPAYLQKLAYPLYYQDLVLAEAMKEKTEPSLVFPLIRQESLFDSHARSWAGASGLTQVMPATGQDIARGLGVKDFVPADLFKPYIAVPFGVRYLALQLRSFDGLAALALAAYNGGPGNAARWRRGNPQGDIDLLVEDITFPETARFVKSIYEHYQAYRAAYRY